MSPEEIRALPAGRELDDLVYLHVFGVADPCDCGTGTGDPDEVCGVCGKPTRRQWSGDIAAAWEVQEAMRRRGDGYAWLVHVASAARLWEMDAEEAAQCICREAVAALEAEREKRERDARAQAP